MLRKSLLLLFISLAFGASGIAPATFAAWSIRGVVVNKIFRATPLSHSLGVDGIYKLELRDEKNIVRRQMVTRAIFLAYEIGDDFDPAGRPPTADERARRLAAIAAEEERAAKTADQPARLASESKRRLVVANFPRDMLPETEGF